MEHSKRIVSLDILRGVAVLGILVMNIQSFSMPGSAYINPSVYGDLNGLNKWVWIFSHLLFNGKFIAIFSMLFGAGIILFAGKAEANGKNGALLHHRRMGWLFLFGLLHSYLLWSGDILVGYSFCGVFVYRFQNKRTESLIWMSLAFFMIPVLIYISAALTRPYWPQEIVEIANKSWKPDEQFIQYNLEIYRGGWLTQMKFRVHSSLFSQTSHFFIQTFWRVTAMMLLGMVLYKWKILSAGQSKGFYLRMTVIGLLSGLFLSIIGVVLSFKSQWSMETSRLIASRLNYVGSVPTALGYVGLVMLICKSAFFQRCKTAFSAVGRMAFSNYILMTLICTFLFYGHGLGWFGSVERKFQALIVVGIWIVILIISPLWLRSFRFGPLESLWRRLTYGTWQPLKK